MRAKRNIMIMVMGFILLVGAKKVLAVNPFTWDLESAYVDANYWGRVSYLEGTGVSRDTITYYAHLDGEEAFTITVDNPAGLRLTQDTGTVIGTYAIYYDHELSTTQSKCYTDYVKVYYGFSQEEIKYQRVN